MYNNNIFILIIYLHWLRFFFIIYLLYMLNYTQFLLYYYYLKKVSTLSPSIQSCIRFILDAASICGHVLWRSLVSSVQKLCGGFALCLQYLSVDSPPAGAAVAGLGHTESLSWERDRNNGRHSGAALWAGLNMFHTGESNTGMFQMSTQTRPVWKLRAPANKTQTGLLLKRQLPH